MPRKYPLATCARDGCEQEHYNAKYCSLDCWHTVVASRHAQREDLKCHRCGKTRNKHKAKFCSRECRELDRYEDKVQAWLRGELSGQSTPGNLAAYARTYIRSCRGSEACWECGWLGYNRSSGRATTQIDHIDGNRHNCAVGNLRLLCPNCHSLTETWGFLNRKQRASSRPVNTLV